MEGIRFVRLDGSDDLTGFDCGDKDLNEFILNDALDYQKSLIAVTYLVKLENEVIAYFSLLNDKLSVKDGSKARWRKIKKQFHHSKHRGDYPAVKLGRLAVSKKFQCSNIGTRIVDFIKYHFIDKNRTGCAFVTVDALRTAIPFYTKNHFHYLDEAQLDTDQLTIQMYFNLNQLI